MTNTIVILPLFLLRLSRIRGNHHQSDVSTQHAPVPLLRRAVTHCATVDDETLFTSIVCVTRTENTDPPNHR
jgi:hypothetical protein